MERRGRRSRTSASPTSPPRTSGSTTPRRRSSSTEKFADGAARRRSRTSWPRSSRRSKWLDDPANRPKAAETIGAEQYVNAPPDEIEGRLTGDVRPRRRPRREGLRRRPDAVLPRRPGQPAPPVARHLGPGPVPALRAASTRRPTYEELADELILTDLYAEVAKAEGVDVPDDDMAPFTVKLDDTTFDPAKPDEEASPTMTIVDRPPVAPIDRAALAGADAGRRPPATRRRGRAGGAAASALAAHRLGAASASPSFVAVWALGASAVARAAVARRDASPTLRDAARRPVLRQRPERQGHRPPAAAPRCSRVFTGFGLAALVGVPLGLRSWAASQRAWQAVNPVDPAPAAGVAAGVVPDLARSCSRTRRRRRCA